MKSASQKLPLLIAHRGDALHFPENTIAAFQSAFEKGSDGIELDIQLYDREIIVVHNFLFDQTKTYPKLQEILELFSSKGRVEIEIKAFDTKIFKPLKLILDSFSQADLELTTSEIPLAIHIKNAFPKIPLGLILNEFFFPDWMTNEIVKQKLVGWGKMTKVDRLHVPIKILSKFGKQQLIKELHNNGFIVHSHLSNTNEQLKEFHDLASWNVDQCTFDNVELLTKI